MKQYETLKKLHDFLVSMDYMPVQCEFDMYYKINATDELMLTHTVFENDYGSTTDEGWDKCTNFRDDWDKKDLLLFKGVDGDPIYICTVTKNGEIIYDKGVESPCPRQD